MILRWQRKNMSVVKCELLSKSETKKQHNHHTFQRFAFSYRQCNVTKSDPVHPNIRPSHLEPSARRANVLESVCGMGGNCKYKIRIVLFNQEHIEINLQCSVSVHALALKSMNYTLHLTLYAIYRLQNAFRNLRSQWGTLSRKSKRQISWRHCTA